MLPKEFITFKVMTDSMIDEMVNHIVDYYNSTVMTQGLAHRVVLIYCMEREIAFNDIVAINKAVDKILRRSSNLHEGGHFLVKDLRNAIKDLPDGMPVMIEKLDEGWVTEDVVFDYQKINATYLEKLTEDEKLLSVEKEGGLYLKQMVPAVHAFGHIVTEDKDGKKLLLLNASY